MKVLARILSNVSKGTYHPIFYYESPLPGPIEDRPSVIRFKSKMHHTTGFATLEEAKSSIEDPEMESKLRQTLFMSEFLKELDKPDPWDGLDLPLDVLIRSAK